MDKIGLNRIGLNRIGSDRIESDRIESDWIESDRWCTCTSALEVGVDQVGHGFDAQSERGVAAGHVAVGRQQRAGAQVAFQIARQPRQVTVAQPFVLRQAQHAQARQRLEQVARQRRQVVVVQRPVVVVNKMKMHPH